MEPLVEMLPHATGPDRELNKRRVPLCSKTYHKKYQNLKLIDFVYLWQRCATADWLRHSLLQHPISLPIGCVPAQVHLHSLEHFLLTTWEDVMAYIVENYALALHASGKLHPVVQWK